ncbi:hypothetical protein ES703_54434 [subsurface metagenome]
MHHSGSPGITAKAVWEVLRSTISTPLSMGLYLLPELMVDDLLGSVVSGDSTNPDRLFDNDLLNPNAFALNQYTDIHLARPCRISELRHHGQTSNANSRYRLQAWVNGAWVDVLVDIVDRNDISWSDWLPVDTVRTSQIWRIECTTFDTNANLREVELKGIPFA